MEPTAEVTLLSLVGSFCISCVDRLGMEFQTLELWRVKTSVVWTEGDYLRYISGSKLPDSDMLHVSFW